MSLIRQLWLLLAATVLAGVLGSAVVTVGSARAYLQTQLGIKNNDNAQALALTLSQQGGDAALLELAIAAQFDTGHYERIRLLDADGRPLVERRSAPQPSAAPAWFVRLVPIDAPPGLAQVSDGWRAVGTLEVASATGFAHADLWAGSLRSAAWLLLLGALTGALGSLLIRRIRRPLEATVEQAQALVEHRFVTVSEPRVPELRQLGRAMNGLVERLQAVFAEQGAQLEALRWRAQTDPMTGLAQREHALARLAALLAREDAQPSGSLLLLRLRDLAELNRSLGRSETDRLLQAAAQVLDAAVRGDPLALAGRLNGADFLVLDAGDPAARAARLDAELRTALAAWPMASVAIGAVAWTRGASPGSVMQRADAALARAEAQGGYAHALADGAAPEAAFGEEGWRRRLGVALERGDAGLGAFALVDRHGEVVHWESPLRLRLQDDGPLEPAAGWLPWAQRLRLMARTDALAVQLALEAIVVDGRQRSVNLSPDSLGDGGFAASLRRQLIAQPAAARLLWLEVDERAALAQLALLRAFGEQLRPLGVRLGIEHAGDRLARRIDQLYEARLDFVKLDRALTLGLAESPQRVDFLRSLASVLHGLGTPVYAEGVSNAADADALWRCGIDGMTGPWVSTGQARGPR